MLHVASIAMICSRRHVLSDDGHDIGIDFVFVYWHLVLVTPDGPRFRSTFLPRLPLAMVVLF